MRSSLSYLRWPLITTVAGVALAGWLGYRFTGSTTGLLSFLMIAIVLAVLEISLSFDNAIVNANKLKEMTPVWQRRFLTWGILIAVFGMRIVFPLLIVVIAAILNEWRWASMAAPAVPAIAGGTPPSVPMLNPTPDTMTAWDRIRAVDSTTRPRKEARAASRTITLIMAWASPCSPRRSGGISLRCAGAGPALAGVSVIGAGGLTDP